MGSINPSPGTVDFTGFRALEPLYKAAKEAGLWIVLRPGPYINAGRCSISSWAAYVNISISETSAGGIAHWITSEVAGALRTNATDWRDAWQDYIKGVITETEKYQISEGGPVIGNIIHPIL